MLFFRKHTLFTLYFIVFSILLFGVVSTSGSTFLIQLFTYFAIFTLTYFLAFKGLAKIKEIRFTPGFDIQLSPYLIFAISSLLIILHLIDLKGFPAFEGFKMLKISELVELRASIPERASNIWGYLSSINAKAILPFTLILLLYKKQKVLFWILILISSLYAFSLMQKSLILSTLIPVFLFCVLQKKLYLAAVNIFISIGVIISLVYVTNPQLRGGVNDLKTQVVKDDHAIQKNSSNAVSSLAHRIFIVPGEMVSKWFETIPSKKPFLKGAGYKIYSKIAGKEYHDYSKELYPIIRPEYAEKEIQGSVNVASFMRAYSNFGNVGLVVSGIFLAVFFIVIEALFERDFKLKLALNAFPVFLLSSGSLTTILLTGGWFFLVVFYYLYKSNFKSLDKC
jgi:hypothetical protein